MTHVAKRLIGLGLTSPSFALLAQTPSAPAPASMPASQGTPDIIVNPTGPTWLVADIGIALIIALAIWWPFVRRYDRELLAAERSAP